MNGLTIHFELLLMVITMIMLLMSLVIAVMLPGIELWSKRFFIAFFTVLLLYGSTGLVEVSLEGRPGSRLALGILYYIDSLFPSLLVLLLTVYLLHCCGENLRGSRLFRIEAALWAGFFILLNTTPFTTWFYYILPENRLCRGPLYPLLLGFVFVMAIIALFGVIRRRRRLPEKYYYAFLISLAMMSAAMLLLFFVSTFALFILGIAFCVFSMYIIILSDQIEQDRRRRQEIVRQQQEIARQRANVLILQMRPHFIYNTLMSIYGLCNQDPQKARQVTMDFTTYLQKNFNAVANGDLITFAAELEHTRAYLAVEQVRYEEMLLVEYDTTFTQFRLPPLTLQPIAENAVKHGINPYSGPLHISIRTQHTDFGAEIIVEDTGPGFDPSDESKPHTTLENIRQRLEMMCGGSMTIKPREGGGTVVTVVIPDSTERKKGLEEV